VTGGRPVVLGPALRAGVALLVVLAAYGVAGQAPWRALARLLVSGSAPQALTGAPLWSAAVALTRAAARALSGWLALIVLAAAERKLGAQDPARPVDPPHGWLAAAGVVVLALALPAAWLVDLLVAPAARPGAAAEALLTWLSIVGGSGAAALVIVGTLAARRRMDETELPELREARPRRASARAPRASAQADQREKTDE